MSDEELERRRRTSREAMMAYMQAQKLHAELTRKFFPVFDVSTGPRTEPGEITPEVLDRLVAAQTQEREALEAHIAAQNAYVEALQQHR